MRKYLIIILVLICGFVKAQTPPRTGFAPWTAKWKFVNPVWLDSGAYITKIVKTSGQNRYLVYDSLTGKIGYRYVSTDLSGYVPYTGATTNVNIGTNTYIGHSLKSDASDGVLIEAANGTDVGIFGAGNTANSSLYGGLTIGSLTSGSGTDSVVVASSAGLLKKRPASAFGSTYTGGNGIIVGGSTIYADTTKIASRRTPIFLTNITTPLIIGGTSTTSTLTYKTTTGVGATGADHIFQVGNNGGTEAMRISNAGVTYVQSLGLLTPGQRTIIYPSGSDNRQVFFRLGHNDAGSGGFQFRDYDANAVLLKIQSNGNVGIGTETPISKLTIPVAPTASANYGLFSLSNTTTAFDGSTTGKFVGSLGTYIAVNSVGSVAYNFLQFSKNGSSVYRVDSTGKVSFNSTITTGGTTGNQTINKPSGTVNIAASGTSVTVTNSLVSTSSIVVAVVRTNDTTSYIKNVVPSAGSFVITLGAAATAEVSIGFIVYN